ncbi:MAG: dihydrofolate reductase family protein [Candidatus Saccharimonadales bacterium]
MRKIILLSMITLDGVMQGMGGPEEDPSDNFKYGGWSAPYDDEVLRETMSKWMQPADLLLGGKTFEIFSSVWPQREAIWPSINDVTKYAVSTTLKDAEWKNSVILSGVEDIEALKQTEGTPLQVWGSSNLAQTLFKHDLVDELWLQIHPLTLGTGKKLFAEGTIPAAFDLVDSTVSPSGVIIAYYRHAGEVKTGTIGV